MNATVNWPTLVYLVCFLLWSLAVAILLCVAFDLAVVRAHLNGAFPRFVFHDGIFELLDPRPRMNLLDSVRASAELGIQSIVTVMDFDLPLKDDGSGHDLSEDDVILRLHDDGDKGRLFHFERW